VALTSFLDEEHDAATLYPQAFAILKNQNYCHVCLGTVVLYLHSKLADAAGAAKNNNPFVFFLNLFARFWKGKLQPRDQG
jgi:hypothetical protein